MALDPFLLEILVCPETKAKVSVADEAMVARLNQQIQAGALKNHAGKTVSEPIDGALVRADGHRAYPVRDDIPIMLVDEGFDL